MASVASIRLARQMSIVVECHCSVIGAENFKHQLVGQAVDGPLGQSTVSLRRPLGDGMRGISHDLGNDLHTCFMLGVG